MEQLPSQLRQLFLELAGRIARLKLLKSKAKYPSSVKPRSDSTFPLDTYCDHGANQEWPPLKPWQKTAVETEWK